MRGFERAKRLFVSDTDELCVTVPIKINEIYSDINGEELEDAVQSSIFSETVEWMGDTVIIEAKEVKKMFNTCAEKLVNHVKNLMREKAVKNTDIFLMVGGFSECEFMQNAIKENFKGVKIITPPDSGLAVVKGAVLFGGRPISVTSRRSKYTYGINISPPFDNFVHPECHQVVVGGSDRCRDVFKAYIRKGDEIQTGVALSGKLGPDEIAVRPDQDELMLKIFVSDQLDPKFVDDKECRYAGTLVVNLPRKGKVNVDVQMIFGDTEMRVEAEELESHVKYIAYFDDL